MGMYASMIVLKTFCDGSVAAMRVFMRGVRPLGFVVLLGRTPGTVHHGRTGGRLTTGTSVVRAAYHPDFHRRSRSCTWSTGRWLRSGRGLSPPARSFTDPGARVASMPHRYGGRRRRLAVASLTCLRPVVVENPRQRAAVRGP